MNQLGSLLNTGVSGIQTGLKGAQKAASDIVNIGAAGEGDALQDLSTAVVDLKTSELQVKASAQVVKVADEILGTLLDTKA